MRRTRVRVRTSKVAIAVDAAVLASLLLALSSLTSLLRDFGMAGQHMPSWVLQAGLPLLLLVSVAVHEAGHVCAGALFGFRLREVHLKVLGLGIRMRRDDGGERTNAEQAVISFAGPAVEIAFGLACANLLVFSYVFQVAGVLIAANGLANLLLPIPGIDASRLYRAAWQVLRGRGREPFAALASVPNGTVPVCLDSPGSDPTTATGP